MDRFPPTYAESGTGIVILVAGGTGEMCRGKCGHRINFADKAFHLVRQPIPVPTGTGSGPNPLSFDSRECLVEHLKVRPEPESLRLALWAETVLPETP